MLTSVLDWNDSTMFCDTPVGCELVPGVNRWKVSRGGMGVE